MVTTGEWWPDVAPERLARMRPAFRAAAAIEYIAEATGADYWKSAAQVLLSQGPNGIDCEDIREVYQDRVLDAYGLASTEALRLAVVDSGLSGLPEYEQDVDDWGRVKVPGVDHATCLWLPDVNPQVDPDEYAAQWQQSRVVIVDPTWKLVCSWDDGPYLRLVWSGGLEGGHWRWRKHFLREQA